MSPAAYIASVDSLVATLKEHHPDNVVMPLRMNGIMKSPAFSHKDGRWTWERFADYADGSLEVNQPIGILMRSLIAIDIDDRSLIQEWEAAYPELQQCPKENTRKGAHYLMARTQLCDEMGITDVAKGMRQEEGSPKMDIDIKTITGTGTAGVLCVAPSPDKTWVREPSGALPPISDHLVTELARMRQHVVGARSRPPRPSPSPPVTRANRPNVEEVDDTEMYRLLSLLGQHRWDDYTTWYKIGMALKAEDTNGALGYREVFDTMSERSSRWTPEASTKWDQLPSESRVGLGTIHMWARQDNPDAYLAFRARTMRYNIRMLSKVGPTDHYHAAKCIQCLHPGEFVSTDEEKRAFYAFRDHRWHVGGASIITKAISNELAAALEEQMREVFDATDEAIHHGTRDERNEAKQQRLAAHKLWSATFNNSWKEAVVKELQHIAYPYDGRTFIESLDAKPELLGFENGILNVITGEFSDGRPEHLVTRTCGYDYTPVVDPEVRAEVDAFISSCFETDEEKDYLLHTLANCLRGYNKYELFPVWLGNTQNGKGATAELMAKTLGSNSVGYAGTLDVSYFTTPARSSSAPTPEVAALQGCRFVTSTEPEEKQQIQGGKLKSISGNDALNTRHCFGRIISFVPRFLVFMQANALPSLTKADDATQRRIMVQPWVYKFTKYPTGEYEKLVDTSIKADKAKSLGWRQQFMLILLEHLQKDMQRPDSKYPVDPPPQVSSASNSYADDCNPMGDWVADRLDFGQGLSTRFREWYEDYKEHALAMGNRPLGNKQARNCLMERYSKKRRLRVIQNNGPVYEGMALRPKEDGQEPCAF